MLNGGSTALASGATNGHLKYKQSSPPRTKCKCCPYGFHIDQDFVSYATTADTREKQLDKIKRKMRKSVDAILRNGRSDTKYDPPPVVGRSASEKAPSGIFSDSLENIVSDFEDTFSSAREQPAWRRDCDIYSSDMDSNISNTRGPVGRSTNGFVSDNEKIYGTTAFRKRPDLGYVSDGGYIVPKGLRLTTNGSSTKDLLVHPNRFSPTLPVPPPPPARQFEQELCNDSLSSTSSAVSSQFPRPSTDPMSRHQFRTSSPRMGVMSPVGNLLPSRSFTPSRMPDRADLDAKLTDLKEERQHLQYELETARRRLPENASNQLPPFSLRPYSSMRLSKERSRSITGGDLTSAYPEDPQDMPSETSSFSRAGSLRRYESNPGMMGNRAYGAKSPSSINLNYFPSARRCPEAGSRVRPDDEYASDTELALGDRFLDRRNSGLAATQRSMQGLNEPRRYANPGINGPPATTKQPEWMRNYEFITGPSPQTVTEQPVRSPDPIPDLPRLPPAIPDLPKYVPILPLRPPSECASSPHPETPRMSPRITTNAPDSTKPALETKKQVFLCDRGTDASPLPRQGPCRDCQFLKEELIKIRAARPAVRSACIGTDKQLKEPCQRCESLRNRLLENAGTNTEHVEMSGRAVEATLPIPCQACSQRGSKRLLSIAVNTTGSFRPTVRTVDQVSGTDPVEIRHSGADPILQPSRDADTSTLDLLRAMRNASMCTEPPFVTHTACQPEGKFTHSIGVWADLTPTPPYSSDEGYSGRVEKANKCVGSAPVRVNTFDKGTVTEYCGKKVKISSIHVVKAQDSPDSGIDQASASTDTSDLVPEAVVVDAKRRNVSVADWMTSTGVNTESITSKDAYLNTDRLQSISRATDTSVRMHDAQVTARWTGVAVGVMAAASPDERVTVGVGEFDVSAGEPCQRCSSETEPVAVLTSSPLLPNTMDHSFTIATGQPSPGGASTENDQISPCSSKSADPDAQKSGEGEDIDDDDSGAFDTSSHEDSPYVPPASAKPKKIDFTKPRGTRATELSRATAMKKLLTTDSSNSQNATASGSFQRGNFMSRSMRVESKKGDPLAYITEKQHNHGTQSTQPTNASALKNSTSTSALHEKVSIKGRTEVSEAISRPESNEATSISLRSSVRSKVTRPISIELREESEPSEEELAEAADKLTPLPSEMPSWKDDAGGYVNVVALEYEKDSLPAGHSKEGKLVSDQPDALPTASRTPRTDSSSSEGEDSPDEGSYAADGNISDKCETKPPKKMTRFNMSKQVEDACATLNAHWLNTADRPAQARVDWARQYLQHEWLKAAARRTAVPTVVEGFLEALERYSRQLLYEVVNMADQNGNTALHYAVSHGNFDVVSILLDSKVCNINKANKAGYTPVMLAALCPTQSETDRVIFQRLFQMGDVNVKASQHGQTALMLAVSHGRLDTTKMLLDAGSLPNIQDEDGSTALMCAAEHGHKDIVRLLLAHPDIHANLADCDGSTALSIAVDNGHRDIGVLIYAHQNFGRSPNASRKLTPMPKRPTP